MSEYLDSRGARAASHTRLATPLDLTWATTFDRIPHRYVYGRQGYGRISTGRPMAMRVCVASHVSLPRMCGAVRASRAPRGGATFGGRGVLERRDQDGRISAGVQRIARMGRAPSSSAVSASTAGEPGQHSFARLRHLPHLQEVDLFRVRACPFSAVFSTLRPPPTLVRRWLKKHTMPPRFRVPTR